MNKQQGFTLIELLISLTLGLIISAAAIQVYLISVRTETTQTGASNVQDVSIFGLQRLENAIRTANLGGSSTSINAATTDGGIILTTANLSGIPSDAVTQTDAYDSNLSVQSDQLTISYTNVSERTMSDCEGADVADDETIVERYYLATEDSSTALYCQAVNKDNIADITQSGSLFMANIDQFKILLGVSPTTSTMTYIDPSLYVANGWTDPITAVRVAVVARGGTAILGETEAASSFIIFGETQTLGSSSTANQIRTVYESNVLLRNARVMHINR